MKGYGSRDQVHSNPFYRSRLDHGFQIHSKTIKSLTTRQIRIQKVHLTWVNEFQALEKALDMVPGPSNGQKFEEMQAWAPAGAIH